MGWMIAVCIATLMVLSLGCSSPQDRAAKAKERSYKADAKFKEERLKALDRYKKCIDKNKGTPEKCEHLRKVIESMK